MVMWKLTQETESSGVHSYMMMMGPSHAGTRRANTGVILGGSRFGLVGDDQAVVCMLLRRRAHSVVRNNNRAKKQNKNRQASKLAAVAAVLTPYDPFWATLAGTRTQTRVLLGDVCQRTGRSVHLWHRAEE
jgi:hypothetical protein